MARGTLRRFDTQAKASWIVSLAAAAGVVVLVFLAGRNLDTELRVIRFSPDSMYKPLYLGICAVTMLLAVVGLVLGFNSAGQRRNEMQTRSWLGFFIGTGSFSLAIVLFWVFWKLQLAL
ncbi:MAG: hypothetical protein IID37_11080 [Planctomycetes bacterium]|nr:hypothetical protein [Planctomycetota bacterium]